MGSAVTEGIAKVREQPAPRSPAAFRRRPWPCRAWVATAVVAALVLPVAVRPWGQQQDPAVAALTGLMLVLVSILNVEIGRVLEGGVSDRQRPHKALSAWAFASALLLPTWWLLPVVAVTYSHARWRGLRVPMWKWVGSAAYVVVAGVAAAVTTRAVLGPDPNLMDGNGLRGLLAVLSAAAAFLAVETVLFHGSAYLNEAADETWLRQTLRSPSFYLTEAGVLLVGGLSAAIWTGGAWFVVLLLPVYALTQRAALHEPLRQRAEHDDKTGLLRFESWRRLAVAGAARCQRRQRPWCVLIADLDHFKRYNDTWGHLAGDQALAAIAQAIAAEIRDTDLLGRFGGEEFCVFLPETDATEAARVAEQIRTSVNAWGLPGEDGVDRVDAVSISVGLAVVDGGEVDFVTALSSADQALFEAKAEGRDTVRVRVLDGGGP